MNKEQITRFKKNYYVFKRFGNWCNLDKLKKGEQVTSGGSYYHWFMAVRKQKMPLRILRLFVVNSCLLWTIRPLLLINARVRKVLFATH